VLSWKERACQLYLECIGRKYCGECFVALGTSWTDQRRVFVIVFVLLAIAPCGVIYKLQVFFGIGTVHMFLPAAVRFCWSALLFTMSSYPRAGRTIYGGLSTPYSTVFIYVFPFSASKPVR
jgi:hypothetical protein